jgi:hypothetical protein
MQREFAFQASGIDPKDWTPDEWKLKGTEAREYREDALHLNQSIANTDLSKINPKFPAGSAIRCLIWPKAALIKVFFSDYQPNTTRQVIPAYPLNDTFNRFGGDGTGVPSGTLLKNPSTRTENQEQTRQQVHEHGRNRNDIVHDGAPYAPRRDRWKGTTRLTYVNKKRW